MPTWIAEPDSHAPAEDELWLICAVCGVPVSDIVIEIGPSNDVTVDVYCIGASGHRGSERIRTAIETVRDNAPRSLRDGRRNVLRMGQWFGGYAFRREAARLRRGGIIGDAVRMRNRMYDDAVTVPMDVPRRDRRELAEAEQAIRDQETHWRRLAESVRVLLDHIIMPCARILARRTRQEAGLDLLLHIIRVASRAWAECPAGLELDAGLGPHDYGPPTDDASERYALLDLRKEIT